MTAGSSVKAELMRMQSTQPRYHAYISNISPTGQKCVRAGFAEDALSDAVPVCLQVGFVLVLRKLQGLTYPGCESEESHAAAFDRHCGPLWQSAGDYGKDM